MEHTACSWHHGQPDSIIYRLIAIFLRNGAEVTVIDVAIVDPASPRSLAKESNTKSDVAGSGSVRGRQAGEVESDWGSRWIDICTIFG